MSFKLLIAPAALALLAGCNTVDPVSGSVDRSFGEAVKYDTAIQIVDPDPVYTAADAQPGDHGERGQKAVDRYRKGAVTKLETMDTTSSKSGSGGGSNPQ